MISQTTKARESGMTNGTEHARKATYVAPTITEVGSVFELTLAKGAGAALDKTFPIGYTGTITFS